jgi:hypothetical protein
MRSLLSFVCELALLAIFTFAWVVVFEHGPQKFTQGAKTEWNALLFFVGSVITNQAGGGSSAPATTVSSPTPASASSLSKGKPGNESISRQVSPSPRPSR